MATRVHQLKAYDPESKGGVEPINGYLETSFPPRRVIASPSDFNTQLTGWLPRANARTVRALDWVVADHHRSDRVTGWAPPGNS